MFIRRFILPLFRSIYFVLFFTAAVLVGSLFYFGPVLGWGDWRPLDSIRVQLIWAAAITVVFLLTGLTIFLIRRRRDRQMTEEITEAATDGGDLIDSEIAELRTKLKTAMAALRKSKNGRRHLNELPWYVMIGPPGAGKTTAIVNSGLNFPLADEMGKGAIGGVGGTRNCDWWFTEQGGSD